MDQRSPAPLTIVAVSPHADDAEYGAGGLLATYAADGHRVTIVLLAGANETRVGEAKEAAAVLGANLVADPTGCDGSLEVTAARVHWLEEHLRDADTVFAPHPDDTHQDHRATAMMTSTALRRSSVGLFWYRTPSSGHGFIPTAFHPVTAASAATRQLAIAMHRTQSDRSYLQPEHLAVKDAWFGWINGHAAAEPFQAVRHQFTSPCDVENAC